MMLSVACVFGCAGELEGDEANYRPSGSAGSGANDGGVTAPDAADDIVACDHVAILNATCALTGCHGATSPAGGLDLASPNLESRLVDVASTHPDCPDRVLVSSGAIDESFFLEKLSPTLPECGDSMPVIGELEADELACLQEWIRGLGGGATAGGGDGG